MLWSALIAFAAGGITTLSPCVLPLLPILLSSSLQEGRWRPLGVMLGFIGAFSLTTLALAFLVRLWSLPPDIHRSLSVALLLLFGIVLAVPPLGHRFEAWAAQLLPATDGGETRPGFWGGLLLGAALGLAWTPCVGPIMAAVITLALNEAVTLGAVIVTLSFSVGASLPMAAVLLGGSALSRRLRWFQRRSDGVRVVLGLLLLLTAGLIASGADRSIQAALLQAFPGWDRALTGWEPKTNWP